METEVHVYGFSIAANVLLSFFPFLIVMVSIFHFILRWPAAEQAIYFALKDYFPGDMGDFIARNVRATAYSRGPLQWVSIFLLFFTANGIFEPLEVALNRAWHITENRSFLKNQVISLGLILACGGLFLVSAMLTGMNQDFVKSLSWAPDSVTAYLSVLLFKLLAVPVSMFTLFLIYWLLPNTKIAPVRVVPVAVVVGFALELFKYLVLLIWPYLHHKLASEYGPFLNSVAIILLSFVASMMILAGAEWAARQKNAPTKHLF